MKKVLSYLIVAQAFLLSATEIEGGYFDIYLKNNCSQKVEVRVRADGSTSVSSYSTNEKHSIPVKSGYEIYVDGKLLKKIEESDKGKELNLCK